MFVFQLGNSKHRRQSIQKAMANGNNPLSSKLTPSNNLTTSSNSSALPHRTNSSSYNSFHHSIPVSSSQTPSSSIRSFLPDNSLSARGRRGRQARPSQLSPAMHRAVRKFSRSVGAPNVVPPAGFRDFRGWLIRLNSRECRPIWDQLISSIGKDVSCDLEIIHSLKEDIVREIVKCVVIPRPDESAKLVSTNAGRQASRPRSGTTLMVVLDQQIARVESRLPQLIAETIPSRSSSTEGRHENPSLSSPHLLSNSILRQTATTVPWTQRQRSSVQHQNRYSSSGRLPSVQDLLVEDGGAPRALPSFRELDASIRRSRSSQPGPRPGTR